VTHIKGIEQMYKGINSLKAFGAQRNRDELSCVAAAAAAGRTPCQWRRRGRGGPEPPQAYPGHDRDTSPDSTPVDPLRCMMMMSQHPAAPAATAPAASRLWAESAAAAPSPLRRGGLP
jgi:hypothetical protein